MLLRRTPFAALLLLLALTDTTSAFTTASLLRSPPATARRCASPEAAAKKKAPKGGKKKAPPSKGGGGFGKASEVALSPAERLRKSMDEYEKLVADRPTATALDEDGELEESDADDVLVKYALTLRCTEETAPVEFSDWVPIGLLNLVCGLEADPGTLVPSVVGSLCREVYEAGAQQMPVLRKAAPQSIEYAFEPLDSFETHVYDGLLGRADRRADAASTLGVEAGASAGEVKKAHRKMMLELHPDRFVGDEEGAAAASEKMLEVQAAYEQLGGGMGGSHGSWYASIGGKARVDFSGPLSKEELGPLGKARVAQEMDLNLGGWRAGIYPMQPEIIKEFATRNTMRSKMEAAKEV